MISKKKMRAAAIGAVTIATVLVAAGAASAVTQGNGSAGAVYVYDTNGAATTNSTSFGWSDDAIASSSAANQNGVFTCNANSTGSYAFITLASKSNAATTPSTWDASKSLGSRVAAKDLLNVNLAPSSFNLGAPAGVKNAGGSYYLGLACTSNNGLTVEAAYYRTVTVTATSGAYSTTDTVLTNQFRFTTQPQSQTVAAGSDVTFTAAFGGTDPAAGTNIKWQRAESGTPTTFVDVPGATTGTLILTGASIANDSGAVYQAVASNNSGSTYSITSSQAVLTVSSTTGSVGMNATVVNAVDGTLSLAVPANASVTFGAATLVSNFSTSTGVLPNITVNDARVHSRPGWNLTASVSDFSFSTNTISKSQLGLVPAVVSATAAGTSAGSTLTAGTAVYPAVIATGLAANTVGNTVLNGALTFVAPQDKPAGTYTSTMTLTLTSK